MSLAVANEGPMLNWLRREPYFSPQNLHSRPPTIPNHIISGGVVPWLDTHTHKHTHTHTHTHKHKHTHTRTQVNVCVIPQQKY